jgi:serine/threonine protein phosphatase PrpC
MFRRAPLCFARRFGLRAVSVLPHPQKSAGGGEDAFFATESALCVADGVGGYASMDVNPATFPRRVCQLTLQAVEESHGKATALEALTRGVKAMEAQRVEGGCPVALVTLINDGCSCSTLNLGDCGIIVLRNGSPLMRTTPQQYYFNCPYQLPDTPVSHGDTSTLTTDVGDIYLVASDGVFDNIYDHDLLALLGQIERHSSQTPSVIERVADEIGSLARRNGMDTGYFSPFSKPGLAEGVQHRGGKLDDVTVVIGVITNGDPVDCRCPRLITDLFP